MYSIHFCIGFYIVLYVCLSDNCTAEISTIGSTTFGIKKKNTTEIYIDKSPKLFLKNNNFSVNYVDYKNESIMFRTNDNYSDYSDKSDKVVSYNKQKDFQNNIVTRERHLTGTDKNIFTDYWGKDRDKNKFYKKRFVKKYDKVNSVKSERNQSLFKNKDKKEKLRNFEPTKPPKVVKKKLIVNYKNNTDSYEDLDEDLAPLNYKKNTNMYQDIDTNVIPLIQQRLDNDLIKKSLDEFTMDRRKTHFTLPDIKYNNDISKQDTDYYDDGIKPNIPNDLNIKYKADTNGLRTDFESDYYTNEITPKYSYPYPTYEEESQILNVLRKQTKLIKKLAQTIIEMDGRRRIDDFSKLIAEVAEKQKEYKNSPNYTAFTFETPTTTTTTPKPTKLTTIITLFDETNVRNALKNDPHVKRILKMASKKRDRYLSNARKYFKPYIF